MKKILLFIIGTVVLTSCKSLYGTYERPDDIQTPTAYRDAAADTVNFGNTPWREVFTDARLQNLIQTALERNTNMQQADLTITQAKAGLTVSRLAFLPAVQLGAQGTATSWDFNKATQIYNVPLSASWQLDAFGTLRNAKKQSEMGLFQAKTAKQAVQTAIIASVANLYYTLEMLDEQLQTTTETAELWNKNVAAMETMYRAGLVNSASLSATKANRLSILTAIPTLKANITNLENNLCAILHDTPHAIERGRLSEAQFPQQPAAGIPLQLLSNRPDVRIAELQLAQAYYGVLGARSAFYPQLSLTGQGSWTNSSGAGLVNPGKILATAVGNLSQPLFAQGKLAANLKVAKAKQESAKLDFEQKLLDAGNEVNAALADLQAAQLRIAGDKELVAELVKNAEQTEFIFKNDNRVTYLETLSAQQNLLQARLNLISDTFDKTQAVISLYQALGGGRN